MELAAAVAATFAFQTIKSTVGCLVSQNHNVDELRREVKRLITKRSFVQRSIESARRRGEIVGENVIRWLQMADETIDQTEEFLDKVEGRARTWHKRSRKARKLRQNVIEIQREGEFDSISHFNPFPKLNYDTSSSRTSILNKIMEILKNPYIGLIGVYGRGAKDTTLTKEVAEKARKDMLFDVVIRVVVAQDQQIKKIGSQVAKEMRLNFEESSQKETEDKDRLKTMLIILDDLCQELDLHQMGIPLGDTRRCKILLTSRDEEVLSRMDIETTFELSRNKQTLSQFSSNQLLKTMPSSVETRVGTLDELEDLDKPSSNIADKAKVAYTPLEAEPSYVKSGVVTPEEPEVLGNTSSNIADTAKVAYTPPKSKGSLDMSVPVKKLEVLRKRTEKELEEVGHPSSNIAILAEVAYKSEGSCSSVLNLHPLISHSYLFPADYEFTKEELIRLWIAEGLFQKNQNPSYRVEDEASVKFDSFVRQELIVPSRTDQVVDFHNPNVKKPLYKLHGSVESSFGPTISDGGYIRVSDGNLDNVPEAITHLCILYKSFDDTKFKTIKRFKYLRTLFVLPDYGVSFKKVPRDLFLSLKNLRTLNFSCSHLSELPSSIGYLKSLQYIDLSYTPIKELPSSIDSLHNLQTLKLRGCFNLVELPHGLKKLTNLRHLDLDVIRQLQSMPPGIGNLTNLQTLSAFLVGKEEGCKIRELKNTINLTGPFCISRLENVLDLEDVKEAALINKNYVTILELRWNDKKVENSTEDEKILEHLRPPLCLQELRILYYGGSKLPTWLSDRSYECLVNLTLYSFKNCRLLPSIGELPSLQFLHITRMNELERIDQLFCRHGSDNSQDHAFPRLQKLTFEDMPKLEEWIGVQSGDFPALHNLQLKYCPKLKSFPSLSCLRKSLKRLEMIYCQNIMPFLDGEENVSLEFLHIKNCPQLKRCFERSHGQDWRKIAHIPNILIDDQEISAQ